MHAWNGTDEITYDANKTAYVYLEKDATRDDYLDIEAGHTLYLCLNGKKTGKFLNKFRRLARDESGHQCLQWCAVHTL